MLSIAPPPLLKKNQKNTLELFKLRLGALIPRSVCLSVGWSVGWSVGLSVLQKLQKNYKTLQNPTQP